MSHAGFQWSDEAQQAAPPAANGGGQFAWSDEKENSSPKAPNVGLTPAAGAPGSIPVEQDRPSAGKLQGLPGVNPHTPTFREGMSDLSLAAAPLLGTMSVPRIAGSLVGGYVGQEGGRALAEKVGAGETGQEVAGDVGGLVGAGIGAHRLGSGIKGFVAPIAEAIRGAEPVFPGASLPEHPGVFPGAPEPVAPAPEVLQANSLLRGPQHIADPAAVLASVPAPGKAGAMAASVEAPSLAPPKAAPIADPAKLGDLLNEGLGGQIPEGHTPVKSSAIRSYKYDPTTKEFEATTASRTYVHGDVSPEQVKAFENASSKGKAWSELKNNSTYVGKIVNGERVFAKPPRDLGSATPDDLTPVLQESLTRAKAAKSARIAKPN